MADSTIVFLVLAGVVVLFVSNRLPVEIVAFATALTLWATDVLTLNQALAGFGDPTVRSATRRRRSPGRRRARRARVLARRTRRGAPEQAAQAVVEGVLLARYRYDALRREPKGTAVTALTVVAADGDEQAVAAGAERGRALAAATQLARDLANTPHSHLTASHARRRRRRRSAASAASRWRCSTRTRWSSWAAAACSASTRAAPSRRA